MLGAEKWTESTIVDVASSELSRGEDLSLLAAHCLQWLKMMFFAPRGTLLVHGQLLAH